jgi:hypothetical protein
MLTTATMAAMKQGLPLKDFPKALRDAAFVTKKLGMKYLWVDALCIVQDDKNDMTQELKSMAQTYHNASLTISAASAIGSREGFLHSRKLQKSRYPRFLLPYRAWDGALGSPGSVVVGEHKMYDAQKEPINQRAWTLQERLLSRRVVIYGTHQLLWQCQHNQQMAGGANGWYGVGTQRLDPSFFNPGMPIKPKEFEYTWIDTVIDYSHRKASVEADKLTALAAIASTFQQNSVGNQYLAGLWKRDLCHYLLWMLDPSLGQTLQPRPSTYVAPSWSWASINGVVAFGGSARDTEGQQVQILHCQTTLENPRLDTGRVTGGFLEIRGPLRETAWASPSTILETTDCHSSPIGKFWIDAVEDKPSTVFCLRVDSDTGLVLAPFDPPGFPSENGSCFRRIGMFEITEGCKSQSDRAKICNDWFMGCETRIIRIR